MAETLKRPEILRQRRDVARVRRHGSKAGTRLLTLRFVRRPEPVPESHSPQSERRIAFFVPRAVRRAVDRNRLKRRLREIYRRNKDWFPAGFDYLLTAGPDCADLEFAELREQTRAVASRVVL